MSEYRQKVKNCAEQGVALMQKLSKENTQEALYLYHRKSTTEKPGELRLVKDSDPKPEGMELTTGEGLRTNIPYENYFQWVYARALRAPILSIS